MKLKNDFEDYMQEVFINENPMLDKHSLPDAFNDYEWGIEELIAHGNAFGANLAQQIIKEYEEDVAGNAESYVAINNKVKAKYLKE